MLQKSPPLLVSTLFLDSSVGLLHADSSVGSLFGAEILILPLTVTKGELLCTEYTGKTLLLEPQPRVGEMCTDTDTSFTS